MHEEVLPRCDERFKRIDCHIVAGERWRIAIIGVVFTIILQVITFASIWGRLTTKVEYIERDLGRIAQKVENNVPSPSVLQR
jgi:hypothetical protein